MKDSLPKYVLSTIAYYDVMDYPMTAFEVWKYLTVINGEQDDDNHCSLSDVIKELEDNPVKFKANQGASKLGRFIEEYRGYYFLRGRKKLVEQRIERNKNSESKYKILRKVVWFLRFVPFVRMIAVTGSVAMKNAEKNSDMDILVVLKHGKIFTGRTLVTLLVHLLGKRRYGKKINNRICLNYFITDKSLEISLKDVFSASEYSFMVPIFGRKTYRLFVQENQWIKKYKPNWQAEEIANFKMVKDSWLAKFIRKIREKILSFDFIEDWLKSWQIPRIMNDPRTKKEDSMIIANDEALIFLPEPQSPKVYDAFRERLDKIVKSL